MVESENVSNVMLIGSIVHEIFQKAIKLHCVDAKQLQKLASDIVYNPTYLQNM